MRAIVLFSAVALTLVMNYAGGAAKPPACGPAGVWRTPAADAALVPAVLLDRLAGQQAVLLGERHDSADDHRWQLHTLAQLHSRQPQLALALEMFPRRLQPVLDRWVAGELAEEDFLRQTEWRTVWGYDAQHYLPLFHFARMNRLPMIAMNIEKSLAETIGKQGWDGVPEAQKEGVTRPAVPSAAYRRELRQVFAHHPARERGEAAFPAFVEAQTVWDRAMAQSIAAALQRAPDTLVVGILGAGHVRNGHGVAHQLKDLGVTRIGALLPWDRANGCHDLEPELADALYLVEPPPANAPRLGVATEPEKAGLRIAEVTPGSIAATAGLQKGDLIVTVAGQPAKSILTLRQTVQRMPPGAWLPLGVTRGEQHLEIVAKFPADP